MTVTQAPDKDNTCVTIRESLPSPMTAIGISGFMCTCVGISNAAAKGSVKIAFSVAMVSGTT